LKDANLHRRQRVTQNQFHPPASAPQGINLFNETPRAVQVTVGTITVTAQATSSPDQHGKQASGDF
jgi:hypothetical protein